MMAPVMIMCQIPHRNGMEHRPRMHGWRVFSFAGGESCNMEVQQRVDGSPSRFEHRLPEKEGIP